MEAADRLLVDRFVPHGSELKTLIEDHQRFEAEIESLNSRASLTPVDRQSLRMLRLRKLEGRGRMAEILRGYRAETIQS